MGLGQTPGKLRCSGVTLPVSGPGNKKSGNRGCGPWALQLPTPQGGALGSGVFVAEAGAPAPDPAHHCCVALTTHSKGRALTNTSATGLFLQNQQLILQAGSMCWWFIFNRRSVEQRHKIRNI